MEKGVPQRRRHPMMVWVLRVSLDHLPVCLSLQYKVRQCPTGDTRKPAQVVQGLGSVLGDWSSLGCDAGLTLCFASPGGRTSYASRMAGCATWHRRLSASCLLTQRKTSSLSPSTQTSLHSGRWPTLAFESPSLGRGALPKHSFRPRAPVCGGKGG